MCVEKCVVQWLAGLILAWWQRRGHAFRIVVSMKVVVGDSLIALRLPCAPVQAQLVCCAVQLLCWYVEMQLCILNLVTVLKETAWWVGGSVCNIACMVLCCWRQYVF